MWSSPWSILGHLLFNINICKMFFQKYECDIASYADGNTPHTYDSDLYTVLSKLKNCTDGLFKWFKENHMKPNGDGTLISIYGSIVKNKMNKTYTVLSLIHLYLSKPTLQVSVKKLVKNYQH